MRLNKMIAALFFAALAIGCKGEEPKLSGQTETENTSPSPTPAATPVVVLPTPSPTPMPTATPSPTPTPTPVAQMVSLSITAPSPFVASGGNELQFLAYATMSDGTVKHVSPIVNWSTSYPTAGSISSSGKFTSSATRGGMTIITATDPATNISATVSLKVLGKVMDITLDSRPSYAVIRPNSRELWVGGVGSPEISIIDMDTNDIIRTIRLYRDRISNHLVFLPDGSKAYTSTGSNLSVEVIDANYKMTLASLEMPNYANQLALSPDGKSLFVTIAAMGGRVDRIDTQTDTVSPFATNVSCPMGVAILPNNSMFVSDQCHVGSDYLYKYASYQSSLSTYVSYQGWIAGSLYPTKSGTRLFVAPGGGDGNTRIVRPSDSAVLETIYETGAITSFNDNSRVLWAMNRAGVYKIYDYTGNTLTEVETIPVRPVGGAAAVTDQHTLYLPVWGTNTLRVWQAK